MTALALAALIQQPFVHSPTEQYTKLDMSGFTVLVSPAAMFDPRAVEPALSLLDTKLSEIKRLLPGEALAKLGGIKIWVERDNPDNQAAVYHPSASWLEEHGYNKDKEKGIEIGNLRNFVDWGTRVQPMLVLHEFAHAYHHQVVGHGDKTVKAAYDAAVKSKRYDKVLFVSGGERKHYAMTNLMEYFAESTEAYFGMNDYYPFSRWQLLAFDRPMYEALVGAWGLPRGISMVMGTSATTEVLRSVGKYRG